MSEEKQELKNCPFCGGKARLRNDIGIHEWGYGKDGKWFSRTLNYEVDCARCHYIGTGLKEHSIEAIKKWNTRAENSQIANLERENFEQSDLIESLTRELQRERFLAESLQEQNEILQNENSDCVRLWGKNMDLETEVERLRAENEQLRSAVVGNGLLEVKK